MHKVVLIQNIIAPYRVGLFEELAQLPGIQLVVLQLARSEPHRKEWEHTRGAFTCKVLRGLRFSRNYDEHTMFNPGLVPFLVNSKPQVVIISGFSPTSTVVVALRKVLRYKVILWFEGTISTDGNIRGIRLFLRRYIATRVDAVIVPGVRSKDYLRELDEALDERRIFVAYNSIDGVVEQGFHSARSQIVNSKNDFEQLSGGDILCVARLIRSKGLWELLLAFEITKERIPSARLLLAGHGPLEVPIRRYCSERGIEDVELLGFLSPPELERAYQKAKVFILLSHIDRNPLVIIEALRAGLPIIASNKIGNVPECVLHGVNGYVVDPNEPYGVAVHLIRLLSDSELRCQFAAKSKMLSRKFSHKSSALVFHNAIQFVKKKT